MMIWVIVLLATTTAICSADDGWTAVQRSKLINHDLENFPLQIQTDSEVGSDETLSVSLYNNGKDLAGAVVLYFTSPPQYQLLYCNTSSTNFPTELPAETDKVWTISKASVSGKIRVVIHCNDKEVLNVVLAETCNKTGWKTYWGRDVSEAQFLRDYDSASDYYRPAPGCTGLNTKWASAIETTTQFPVNPGTVVEVTCLHSDSSSKGTSQVTCVTGKIFTSSEESRCPLPDCTGLKTTWTNMKADKQFPVSTGTVLSLSCNEGYELKGDKTVTCTKYKKFQFSAKPTCDPCPDGTYRDSSMSECQQCPDNTVSTKGAESCTPCETGLTNSQKTKCRCSPLSVNDAKVSPNGPVTEGTDVTVTCKKPKRYVLMGEKYVTCQSHGWNNTPECRKCENKF